MADTSAPWVGEPGYDRRLPMLVDNEGKEVKILPEYEEKGVKDEVVR